MTKFNSSGVVAATVAVSLLLGALPAAAADCPLGSSYALDANVSAPSLPAPVATGQLALSRTAEAGGPTSNSLASHDVSRVVGVAAAQTKANFDQPTGTLASSATIASVNVTLLQALGGFSLTNLEVSCTADTQGVRTSMGLATGFVLGNSVPIPVPSNYRIPITDPAGQFRGEAVLNEVVSDPAGGTTITGAHIYLTGGTASGSIVVASATCGPACPPIPLASGAGLWIGLGLLGLIAIPVGATRIRRRHPAFTA